MKKSILSSVLITFFLIYPALSQEENNDKLDKALERYDKTGKIENCIMTARIRTTRVVDDNHIIFEINSKTAYLNTLPRRCPRLGFERGFSYKSSTGRLCNVDIITVLDTGSRVQGPSCGLGKFEELARKEK